MWENSRSEYYSLSKETFTAFLNGSLPKVSNIL